MQLLLERTLDASSKTKTRAAITPAPESDIATEEPYPRDRGEICDDLPWVNLDSVDLQALLMRFGINTQIVDRYIVTQSKQAVEVQDPVRLVSSYCHDVANPPDIMRTYQVINIYILMYSIIL